MKEPTLPQRKILQALDEDCKLFHRTGLFGGAWLVEQDLTCIPIRLQTFNGLVLRGLIEPADPMIIGAKFKYSGFADATEYRRRNS